MSSPGDFLGLLAPHADGEMLHRLTAYAEILERWAGRHNLVRFASRAELVNRHILDSLAATPFLGERGRLVDVGSGAGLPGVPLLVARPHWCGVLLEPRQKRWAFLRAVVRELGLEAAVERVRYEDYDDSGPFDVVTARAVGRHHAMLGWAKTRLTTDGEVLLWTTADGLEGLRASAGWRVLSSELPGLECGRLARLQPCFT